MNREEAIAIIRKEYLCVDRDCDIDRSCGKCDLMMPSKEPILEAYKMAIKALEQEPCRYWQNGKCNGNTEVCEDAISRQDVLDLAKKGILVSNGNYESVCKAINEIPAVNPQPCEDAISRQAVLDILKREGRKWGNNYRDWVDAIEEIKNLSSVNPTKTGHWIEHPEIETSTPEYLMFYECSECGDRQCFCKSDIHKKRFCGNCGCRMVEPQESEGEE